MTSDCGVLTINRDAAELDWTLKTKESPMKSQKNLRFVTLAIIIAGLEAVFVEGASGAVDDALARNQAALVYPG